MPRKRQDKIDKTKIDFMKPIDINIFGGQDDPCFGKLYSPAAKECSVCGDSEICAIVCSQKSKLIRGKLEEKHAFKDLEEVDIAVQKVVKNIVKTNKITRFIEVLGLLRKKIKYTTKEEAETALRKAIKSL